MLEPVTLLSEAGARLVVLMEFAEVAEQIADRDPGSVGRWFRAREARFNADGTVKTNADGTFDPGPPALVNGRAVFAVRKGAAQL